MLKSYRLLAHCLLWGKWGGVIRNPTPHGAQIVISSKNVESFYERVCECECLVLHVSLIMTFETGKQT